MGSTQDGGGRTLTTGLPVLRAQPSINQVPALLSISTGDQRAGVPSGVRQLPRTLHTKNSKQTPPPTVGPLLPAWASPHKLLPSLPSLTLCLVPTALRHSSTFCQSHHLSPLPLPFPPQTVPTASHFPAMPSLRALGSPEALAFPQWSALLLAETLLEYPLPFARAC